jgi:hypothetical protein
MTDFPRPRASVELVTVHADDDPLVHLSGSTRVHSLCGRSVRATSTRTSFRVAGCGACLQVAREAMYTVARDRGESWINLARLRSAAG